MSEKTEKPTPKKLRDARKKGQVAQSRDVVKLAACGVTLELIIVMQERWMDMLKSSLTLSLNRLHLPFEAVLPEVVTNAFTVFFLISVIALVVASTLTLAGTWAQIGFFFSVEAAMPKFEKLNPVGALKQMFSLKKLIDITLAVLKTCLFLYIGQKIVIDTLATLVLLSTGSMDDAFRAAMDLMRTLAHIMLVVALVLAGVDFGLQKWNHIKGLMMSHDEIKREYKESEGDPHVKGQRKSLMHELAMEEPVRRAREADAVVVNPTHFAVALMYKPGETPLPVVLAKGRDHVAQAMINAARDADVPVIRFVSLARTLYATGREDHRIPRPTLKATALVFRIIEELRANAAYRDVFEVNEVAMEQYLS